MQEIRLNFKPTDSNALHAKLQKELGDKYLSFSTDSGAPLFDEFGKLIPDPQRDGWLTDDRKFRLEMADDATDSDIAKALKIIQG